MSLLKFTTPSFTAVKEKIFQTPPADVITWVSIAVASTAAVLSLFEVCSSACTDAALYTLFGVSFVTVGIPFFILLAGLFAFHYKSKSETAEIAGAVANWLCFSAAGAEVFFLAVQKYGIGHWCPTCVTIAAAVIILASTRLWMRLRSGISKKQAVAATLAAVWFALVGFLVSVVGIEAPVDTAEAQAVVSKQGATSLSDESIWFGDTASNVEVYFVSDWYCPFCRAAEGDIEHALPDLGKVAKYTFLDLIAHKQSRTLAPYGTSLLLGDKAQYLSGRAALLKVSEGNIIPTDAEILAAFQNHGVNYRAADPSRARVLDAMSAVFFLQHNVRSTPSVVVINKVTKQQQIVSAEQFKVADILSAIAAVK